MDIGEIMNETKELVQANLNLDKLKRENKEMKELLSTFKSMFEDGNNDVYLEMIKGLKTEIK